MAAGVGWASKIKKTDTIAMAFFGDGGTARGDFHEALNFAGIHKLGCVFVCQNNLWAESVPWQLNSPVPIADRAKAYASLVFASTATTHSRCTTSRWRRSSARGAATAPRSSKR